MGEATSASGSARSRNERVWKDWNGWKKGRTCADGEAEDEAEDDGGDGAAGRRRRRRRRRRWVAGVERQTPHVLDDGARHLPKPSECFRSISAFSLPWLSFDLTGNQGFPNWWVLTPIGVATHPLRLASRTVRPSFPNLWVATPNRGHDPPVTS